MELCIRDMLINDASDVSHYRKAKCIVFLCRYICVRARYAMCSKHTCSRFKSDFFLNDTLLDKCHGAEESLLVQHFMVRVRVRKLRVRFFRDDHNEKSSLSETKMFDHTSHIWKSLSQYSRCRSPICSLLHNEILMGPYSGFSPLDQSLTTGWMRKY